jgi:predicted DsbA family dithiol-disulfide isomerase
LISLARKQGRENAMVEEIYSGNHEQNQPLSEWTFLLAAAERAGVTGAEEMLKSDQEVAEVKAKIRKHVEAGINAVPVLVINDQEPIHGAPDHELLAQAFAAEISKTKRMARA